MIHSKSHNWSCMQDQYFSRLKPIFIHLPFLCEMPISKSIHQRWTKTSSRPTFFIFWQSVRLKFMSQCGRKYLHFIATMQAQSIALFFHISGVGVHSPIINSGMLSHWLNRQIDFLVNTCSYSCSSEDLNNEVVKELCIITTRVTQASHVRLRPVLEVQTHWSSLQ